MGEDTVVRTGLLIVTALAASVAAAAAVAQQAGVAEVWTLDGLSAPESALYDPVGQRIYVSNVVGGPLDADGRGFISRVSPDGEMLELEWATGFHAPKGMALQDGTLYVADIEELVAIDADTGKVSARWAARDGDLLNDVTIDADGRVFVSGTLGNRIYLLENDALSVWLEDDALNRPNGLKAHDGRIVVACWGQMPEESATPEPGRLLEVDLGTREISPFGEGEPTGNLDGIEPDGEGGWLVTEFMGGGLFRIDDAGKARLLRATPQGSADLAFIADRGVAVVPVMLSDTLVAYRVE